MKRRNPSTVSAKTLHCQDVPWGWVIWLLLGALVFPLAVAEADSTEDQPAGELVSIEREGPPDRPQVHFKFTRPIRHKTFTLTDPDRIVINFTPCRLKVPAVAAIRQGALVRLRCSQFTADTVRVVLDLSHKTAYSLTPPEGETSGISVELNGRIQEKKVQTRKQVPPLAEGESLKKVAEPGDKGDKPREAPKRNTDFRQDLTREMEALAQKGAHREVIRRYRLHQGDLEQEPNSDLLILVGKSFRALGFFDPALRLFHKAWQGEAQGSPRLILEWSETLVDKEDWAAAHPLIRSLVDHADAAPAQKLQGYRLLARCLSKQNLHLEAYKTLEAARTRFPKMIPDAEFLFLEGMTAFEIPGLGRKAQEALKAVVILNQEPSKKGLAHERLGDLFFGEKRYLDAWRAYYQAYRLTATQSSPFLVKKLTQCRLLTEEKKPGSSSEKGVIENDLFWNKLYEARFNQRQLEKQVGALRLP